MKPSPDRIRTILERSVNAPSGSNSQPWRFALRGGSLDLIALSDKDHPILNYRRRGTLIAHGALAENIRIAAAAAGLATEMRVLPDGEDAPVTARLSFSDSAPSEEALAAHISLRATNRQPYVAERRLTALQLRYLTESPGEVGGGSRFAYTTDRSSIDRLARVAAANEIVTLENEDLHRLFFQEIAWSREEEKARGGGMYVKTMGLAPPQEAMIRPLRYWPAMRSLNMLGFARMIAAGNAKAYAATPLIGAVFADDDDAAFFAAGRLIERIWLKASRLGFGCHLMAGTLFFRHALSGGADFLSSAHAALIEEEYRAAQRQFPEERGEIAALLRIGVPRRPPKALSLKVPPVVEAGGPRA